MTWSKRGGEYEAEANGFGLRVYFDGEPIVGEPVWIWSAMRFLHPESETDDRIIHLGGEAATRAAAQRQAARAAMRYDS